MFELLRNLNSWYNCETQRLSDIALVCLSMLNSEGGTKAGAVFFFNKNVKAINSKHHKITCFKGIKMQAFQDQLITENTAHTLR